MRKMIMFHNESEKEMLDLDCARSLVYLTFISISRLAQCFTHSQTMRVRERGLSVFFRGKAIALETKHCFADNLCETVAERDDIFNAVHYF